MEDIILKRKNEQKCIFNYLDFRKSYIQINVGNIRMPVLIIAILKESHYSYL